MNAEERQQEILRRARAGGRVDVMSLAEEFRVTGETIRRDLTTLERTGAVRRVYGGAVPVGRPPVDSALSVRDSIMTAEKERIAKTALAEVPDEGAIIIDAGSTTGMLAEVLPMERELTVIVNSPPLATLLTPRANLTVVLLGGRVRRSSLATVDDWLLQPLSQMYVDVAFIGTSGISIERGLTTPDPGEASVKASMIAAARRTVVLADHTKIGNHSLARFGSLADVDVLITDVGIDDGTAAAIGLAGPRVVRA
ncbi:DeoR/GlpR family DNA-binding transcription regulator [Actinoallomurus sp. NPDC050550]|uniref:DeoR/GlpR family DNA-binding transcription regulator n=1 Tax=Actinoallomurus sp. NPDC050550 TaxID=3154937 RepID=UPI0033F82BE3